MTPAPPLPDSRLYSAISRFSAVPAMARARRHFRAGGYTGQDACTAAPLRPFLLYGVRPVLQLPSGPRMRSAEYPRGQGKSVRAAGLNWGGGGVSAAGALGNTRLQKPELLCREGRRKERKKAVFCSKNFCFAGKKLKSFYFCRYFCRLGSLRGGREGRGAGSVRQEPEYQTRFTVYKRKGQQINVQIGEQTYKKMKTRAFPARFPASGR